MKVTNWKRKVAATLLAAGLWSPGAAHALNIPLVDPSFEAYTVSTAGAAGTQYAYANKYRVTPPTSAWIDDQDNPGAAYVQDNISSNWLYTTAYADKGTGARRGSPRTGNQAMHGLFRYSSQEVAQTFEAGKTYTFSIYAQGDHDSALTGGSGWQSRVFLYIFDGSVPFSEFNSLAFDRYSPTDSINLGPNDFINRDPAWTAAQSKAIGWTQISLSYTVPSGSSAIGHPIGVGFYMGDDACVDDASLSVVPEPGAAALAGLGALAGLRFRRRKK